jgi:hypothetical protein
MTTPSTRREIPDSASEWWTHSVSPQNCSRSEQTTRRDFLDFSLRGLGGAALLHLLAKDNVHAAQPRTPLPHFPANAKRAVHICLVGGFSHVDTFDYKPELRKLHGKDIPDTVKPDTFFGSLGLMRQNEWEFHRRGQSGLWISDLFPHLATVADELTVIRSMHSESANHQPAMFLQNSGFGANGFPSLGSWLSYGLGNDSESLPTFVVLPDARSLPNSGAANWTSGFLPAQHQGTLFGSGRNPVRNLFAETEISEQSEKEARALLQTINRKHLERRGDDLLKARIRAYELSARMQTTVPETIDFSDESAATREQYGLGQKETDSCGRRCLLARRLLERGVRFVQIYSGGAFGGKPRHGWDGHENNYVNHTREAKMIDQPVAAFLGDLRQRGMLDDTLILFTSEFGRTPFTQAGAGKLGKGRDHNPEGFTTWLAGAGLKHGITYGATDEVGWKAAENPVSWPDFHSTVLHLLGLDHERVTFYHNGIERRLTNVHGHVMKEILA